jgi:3-(3-hydroxy-phenyl)propionate hydroxylase
LADAEDLAWRLALVERHGAGSSLLDGYDTERMAAARENFAITDGTARFMAPPTAWTRVRRTAVLWASRHSTWARRHINAGRFYRPTRLPGRQEGSLAGAVIPDAPCKIDSSDGRLRDLVGKGFLLLGVGAVPGWASGLCHCDTSATADAFPCACVVLVDKDTVTPDGTTAVVMADKEADVYRGGLAPGATRFLIVRPDAYVADAIDISANDETEAARARIFDALAAASGQAKLELRRSNP